ncbi:MULTISPECIES: hypothetical protein [unclassified Streptomyces]|uniref:hypothetical protein n=1 Tax=unclassified Streptomyces TaxID=2593676 RepID=UPI0036F0059F
MSTPSGKRTSQTSWQPPQSLEPHERQAKTFADPRLCEATVDRLTFNDATIQPGTESPRLAHTKAQAERAEAG